MGACGTVSINNYELMSMKEFIFDDIMSVFTENHRIEKQVHYDDDDDDETYTKIAYTMTCKEFSDRLNVLGFSYKRAIKNFNETFDEEEYFELFDYELPKNIDFSFFEELIKLIIEKNIHSYQLSNFNFGNEIDRETLDLYKYVINREDYDYFLLGIPLSDYRYLMQIIFKIINYEGIIEYDVTELIGYYYDDRAFSDHSRQLIKTRNNQIDKIIIITEGSSDMNILQAGMNKLYPHLSDLYSFFDFKGANAQGSTSEVVRIIKSFIASGISNKTIAIVDNDTAGKVAIKQLEEIDIPDNIKILKYPDIDLCKNYPTLGPNGSETMNINGLAASIELYLGKNVLMDKNNLIPIQWTGYLDKVKQYQGVIINKEQVIKKFYNKLKSDPQSIDWSNIDKILTVIFKAFL